MDRDSILAVSLLLATAGIASIFSSAALGFGSTRMKVIFCLGWVLFILAMIFFPVMIDRYGWRA